MTRGRLAAAAAISIWLGCGSPIDRPTSNLQACVTLRQAIDKKCLDADEIPWLNCAVLPGCPAGDVEAAHVETCVQKIGTATSCEAAKGVQCTISKVDCQSESATFETACANVLAILQERSCPTSSFDCGRDYVPCGGDAKLEALKGCLKPEDTCEQAPARYQACLCPTEAVSP